jgi:hypothetical protein
MSFTRRLRTICACLILEAGVLMGVPVRVEQVEELLRSLNQPKVAQTDPEKDEEGAE